MKSDDKVSAVEARLMKDVNNLKRENKVLVEDSEVIITQAGKQGPGGVFRGNYYTSGKTRSSWKIPR